MVRQALADNAATVLLDPRQVGKSTLAGTIAAERSDSVYLDLELDQDLRKLDDAAAYLRGTAGRLTVIDEVHRAPQLFATLRSLIDERRRAGHRAGEFLLLGSASLDLLQHSAETLAGRVTYIEFQPIGPEGAAGSDIGLDSLLARDDASADAPCSHLSCLVLFGIESRIQE